MNPATKLEVFWFWSAPGIWDHFCGQVSVPCWLLWPMWQHGEKVSGTTETTLKRWKFPFILEYRISNEISFKSFLLPGKVRTMVFLAVYDKTFGGFLYFKKSWHFEYWQQLQTSLTQNCFLDFDMWCWKDGCLETFYLHFSPLCKKKLPAVGEKGY